MKRHHPMPLFLLTLSLVFVMSGCAKDPSKDAPQATVGEAKSPAATASPSGGPSATVVS